ncbi:MAG: RAMP superfamily CRISPR-associated protein [Bacteroidaceae bacterium]|nr:RAMP superfamily CRISPR-associated protein [Bacteroidaceae bacterium]
MEVNKRFNVGIEIITPVSIGVGAENDWVKGVDFVQKDGKVYILDMKRIVEHGYDPNKLCDFFLNGDPDGVIRILGNDLEKVAIMIFGQKVPSDNPIKTMLKNDVYGTPLIAGSSLKGAIRSCLFAHLRSEEKERDAEKKVFGSLKDGEEFGRFIKVTDVDFKETELVNSKIFNLQKKGEEWTGGWKHEMNKTGYYYSSVGFNTLYESIVTGSKGVGSIMHADKVFHSFVSQSKNAMPYQEKKSKVVDGDLSYLFSIINKHTLSYLKKELHFFNTYRAGKSEQIIESIEHLIRLIPEDGSFALMKMSAGTGFHSITGDWQYEDYTETGVWEGGRNYGKKKYKSRKIAEHNGKLTLMGFVKLSAISEDDYKKGLEDVASYRQSIVKKSKQDKEEALRLAEIARQEKEASELEKKKNEEYENLITEAIRLEDKDNNAALDLLNKAKELCPERDRHEGIIKRIVDAISKAQSSQKSAVDYNKPLDELLSCTRPYIKEIIKTTARWVKAGNTLNDDAMKCVADAIKALNDKKRKKMKQSYKDVCKALGKENADILTTLLN